MNVESDCFLLSILNVSLQAGVVPPKRDDGGVAFLKKVARQYASKGEKAYNFGQPESKNLQTVGASVIGHCRTYVQVCEHVVPYASIMTTSTVTSSANFLVLFLLERA